MALAPSTIAFFSRSSSAIALCAVVRDYRALRRIVAVDEVGRERVDARLQRIGVDLVALDLVLGLLHAVTPVFLVRACPQSRRLLVSDRPGQRPGVAQKHYLEGEAAGVVASDQA